MITLEKSLGLKWVTPYFFMMRDADFNTPEIGIVEWPSIKAEPKFHDEQIVTARVVSQDLERGQIEPIEVDDVDLEWIEPDALKALPPIASYAAVLTFEGKVTSGSFAPIEVDDIDLELFD